MKVLPTIQELKEGFTDFSLFTLELLEKIESDKKYLKFAAVNSQISLELFLKYLYINDGKVSEIQKTKNGQPINELKDFSQIMNHFYTSNNWSYGNKKEFVTIMETRNSIVHKAQKQQWDEELAKSIVRIIFFIHTTAWYKFNEILLFTNYYTPRKISNNEIWQKGVESFIDDLVDIHTDCNILTCPFCNKYTLVNGSVFGVDYYSTEDDLICLNCLTSIDTTNESRLLECYKCSNKAYLIDAFNEQDNQLYSGKCLECGTDSDVRKCLNCQDFYHPSKSTEVRKQDKYFCCCDCEECYNDVQS